MFFAKRNKKNPKKLLVLTGWSFVFFCVIFVSHSLAAPDQELTYHGKLTDNMGLAVPNGSYTFTLSIYGSETGSDCLWTARGSCGSPVSKSLVVTNGIFSTTLGESGDNPLILDFTQNYYLGVTIDANVEMTPRRKITPMGFALNSHRLNGLTADNYINTSATAQTKTGALALNGDFAVNTSNFFVNTSTGRVGIGTTVPSAKLHAIATTEQLRLSYNASNFFSTTINSTGGVTLNAVGVGQGFTFTDPVNVTGALTTGGQITSIIATGTAPFSVSSTTLNLNLNADLLDGEHGSYYRNASNVNAGILSVLYGGSGTATQFSPGSIVFAGASGVYTQNNANFFWDNANDRLGIGTNTPSAMLDLFGVNNKLRFSYDAANYTDISVNNQGQFVMNSSYGSDAALTVGSGLAQDASVKYNGYMHDFFAGIDDADGVYKIGVGSAVASSATVIGPGTVSNLAGGTQVTGTSTQFTNTFRVGQSITIGTQTVTISAISSDTAMTTSVITDAHTNVTYAYFGGSRIALEANGNVGIGTTNPIYTFDVNGDVRITGVLYDAFNMPGTNGQFLSSTASGTQWIDMAYNIAMGDSIDSATPGSVLFAGTGGVLQQDNANFFWDNTNKRLGMSTTVPQGVIDLGAATSGRSIVWGGSTGTNHYGTIGTSYSSGDLNMLSGLKLNPVLDEHQYSYTGTYGVAGIELDFGTEGGIRFFTEASAAHTKDATFSSTANEKMRITDDGNVGIGTTNPITKLHVAGSNSPTIRLQQTDSLWGLQTWDVSGNETNFFIRDVTAGSLIPFKILSGAPTNSFVISSNGNIGLGTTSPTARLHIKQNVDTEYGGLEISNISGGAQVSLFVDSSSITHLGGTVASPNAINIANSTGNVSVGATPSSVAKFFVNPAGSGTYGAYVMGPGTTSSTFGLLVRDSGGATNNFYIRDDGAGYLRAAAWTYGSDRRMKENINPLNYGLDTILNLKTKQFDYISGMKNQFGFIAQDIQNIIPEMVSTQENGMLGLQTDMLIPIMVNAMQEQNILIQTNALNINDNMLSVVDLQGQTVNSFADVQKALSAVHDNHAALQEDLAVLSSRYANIESDMLDEIDARITLRMDEMNEDFSAIMNFADIAQDIIVNADRLVMMDEDHGLTIEGVMVASRIETNSIVISGEEDSAMIGEATIAADAFDVFVPTNAVIQNSRIFVTPKGGVVTQTLAITRIDDHSGFHVTVAKPTDEPIKFDWLIVDDEVERDAEDNITDVEISTDEISPESIDQDVSDNTVQDLNISSNL